MEALSKFTKKIKKAMSMAAPSFTTISAKLVTIEVGSGEEIKRFSVHQELLTTSSKYFKSAFEGEFREAKQDFLPLLDVKPIQFQNFLDGCILAVFLVLLLPP